MVENLVSEILFLDLQDVFVMNDALVNLFLELTCFGVLLLYLGNSLEKGLFVFCTKDRCAS
jgi:hypothetical protein